MAEVLGRRSKLRDVAARAGVSQGLVSRILNHDANLSIRPETRAAVLAAVQELGYVPNSLATGLRKSRTNAIGLVLEHVTTPMFTEMVHGAQQMAAEFNCVLLLVDAAESESESWLFEEVVKAGRIDGLLLQGGYGEREAKFARSGAIVPTVMVNRPGNEYASGVRLPDDAATRLATEHLLDLGHTDVMFVSGTPGFASDTRRKGFAAALAATGIEPRDDMVLYGGWVAQEGYEAVARYLDSGRRPSAFVAGNAAAALGVLGTLAEHGVQVPNDASVIAVHDPWFAAFLNPPLTTVALPMEELGRQAVRQLMEHLDGSRPPDVVIESPRPKLVERGSTRRID